MISGKRSFDIIFSFLSLFVLLPLFSIIAIVIFLSYGRPILFIQERPGKNGRIFKLIKFRTMKAITDQALGDEDRITPVGRLLRSSSLDELPELYNVLIGDMSFVGPRPLLVEYLDLYSEFQSRRHETKPGITGWAQVNGRNSISWKEKFELDVWYVDNRSFLLDVKIIIITMKKILQRDGINSKDHATMSKFKGNNEDK